MKTYLLPLIILLFSASFSMAQDDAKNNKKLYNPDADAKADIAKALKEAKKDGKHVVLQIGGNWCGWCIAFDKKVNENEALTKLMADNFVVYHLNYSKENKNTEVLKELDFPQRFGFPVFVILDADGKRLHTQNSAYLEEGEGHSVQKIIDCFENWSPKALDPSAYKEK
jgi:thioredoxin-related protein